MIPRTNSCEIKQGQILVNKADGMTCSHFILDKHPLTSGFSLLCELLQSSFSPVSGVRPQQSQRKSPTDSPWHLEGTNWYQHLAQIATIPTVRTPSPSCLHESKMGPKLHANSIQILLPVPRWYLSSVCVFSVFLTRSSWGFSDDAGHAGRCFHPASLVSQRGLHRMIAPSSPTP